MTVRITIIGMGKIGTSIGLALQKHTEAVHRTGHDIVPEFSRRAHKMGALDKVAYNLPASVRKADLVVLALPADQVRETLRVIALDLKENAVVVDTSPTKQALAIWMKELVSPDRYYVGLTPVLNPAYLHMLETGIEAAREDLFQRGIIGIAAPQGTDSAALKLAADLTQLLGATPLFADLVELDSLMTTSHLLPQLLAGGLMTATAGQPGWKEGQKLAGNSYALAGSAISAGDSPEAISAAAILNREAALRALDNVIASLNELREAIANQDEEKLTSKLAQARESRESWFAQRVEGIWEGEGLPSVEMPTSTQEMGRIFGFNLGRKRPDGG